MSCPTCDHTLSSLPYTSMDVKHFHCDRCGTLVTDYPGGHRDVYVPKLVKRCRMFQGELLASGEVEGLASIWETIGIDEAINTPEKR